MDWHSRMQAMINTAESNLDPHSLTAQRRLTANTAVVHVDRHSVDVPVQHQIYELDNRVRLCLNELSDVRIQIEKNGKEVVGTSIAKVKEDLTRDVSLLEKRTQDEFRVLGHDLRCRVADAEALAKEDKRKREDMLKKAAFKEEQTVEIYDSMKELTSKLTQKVDMLESELRHRNRDVVRVEDSRFDDIRNETRYQAERMEENKRQLGLRMDKVADIVRLEVVNMGEMVKSLVHDVWKEHMTSVYSKVNESLETFNASLSRQTERVRDLESTVHAQQSHTEAEVTKLFESIRKCQHGIAKAEREQAKMGEDIDTLRMQLAPLRGTPDEISRLHLTYQKLHETVPNVEAAVRKHAALIEVIKDVPDVVEDLKWEVRRMQEPVQRQEAVVGDALKRCRHSEEMVQGVFDTVDELRVQAAADKVAMSRNTKNVNNSLTKLGELEEEDGRKTATLEKMRHQLQEHQTSLRSIFPQMTSLSCTVDTMKMQNDPKLANAETQLQELWRQFRDLQARFTSFNISREVSAFATEATPARLKASAVEFDVSQTPVRMAHSDGDAERERREQADRERERAEREKAERDAAEQAARAREREEREAALVRERQEAVERRLEEERREEMAARSAEEAARAKERAEAAQREQEAAAQREKDAAEDRERQWRIDAARKDAEAAEAERQAAEQRRKEADAQREAERRAREAEDRERQEKAAAERRAQEEAADRAREEREREREREREQNERERERERAELEERQLRDELKLKQDLEEQPQPQPEKSQAATPEKDAPTDEPAGSDPRPQSSVVHDFDSPSSFDASPPPVDVSPAGKPPTDKASAKSDGHDIWDTQSSERTKSSKFTPSSKMSKDSMEAAALRELGLLDESPAPKTASRAGDTSQQASAKGDAAGGGSTVGSTRSSGRNVTFTIGESVFPTGAEAGTGKGSAVPGFGIPSPDPKGASSDESSSMTLSTGVTSAVSSRRSKRSSLAGKGSARPVKDSGSPDAQPVRAGVPPIAPTSSSGPPAVAPAPAAQTRPGSIFAAVTSSESELEKPLRRNIVTDDSDAAPPVAVEADRSARSSRARSSARSSRVSTASSSKSAFSLPE
eukprot:TRINITY_DN18303_c0_g1_i2.p1 TRINITY_DN18303_c0_g1~~TRINITY_DN18303_c0_g1_i2.p1  ORF type:complete len:1135 (+),score=463.65 TRINITY_DN18303_c0_g1_i2:127-3405(+)